MSDTINLTFTEEQFLTIQDALESVHDNCDDQLDADFITEILTDSSTDWKNARVDQVEAVQGALDDYAQQCSDEQDADFVYGIINHISDQWFDQDLDKANSFGV